MDDLDSESPDVARDIIVHNILHVLAVSILYYDHILTFDEEVHHLWLRPKGPSTYWFFLNRYFSFFGNLVVTIIAFRSLSAESCKSYNLFRQLLLVFNQVIVCILLTLRIYALYNRSVRILCFMVGGGMVLLGASCWSLFGQKSVPSQPGTGCHLGLSRETSIHIATAWEALMVYDSMIFSFTLYRTWTTRQDHAITGINIPLVSLILRDGAIYYAVMALANLANILTFYLPGPFLRGSLSTFASSISVTMMSRLMLNLHQKADTGVYSVQTTGTMLYTDSAYSGCEQSDGVELDTLWSNMSDNSPRHSPVQSRFTAPNDQESADMRRQSQIRWRD